MHAQLHEANLNLRQVHKNDVDYRDQHLNDLIDQAVRDDPNTKIPSYIKSIKQIESQKKNARAIRSVLKGRHDGALSYLLIPAESEYPEAIRSQPDFSHLNMRTIWTRIIPTNGKDICEWEILDQQSEVERLSIECMKLHFSQSNETALTSDYWIETLMNHECQQKILQGTFDLSPFPEPVQIFFQAMHKKHVNDSLTFEYSFDDFRYFVQSAEESTSSSPSGRHYGHFKVLNIHLPDVLKDVHKIMCLCMKHNIFLPRYCKTVTTLIGKDDGMPKIHRLRPIHLVEIEVQAIAKSQWSSKLINHAERKKLVTDGQFGWRASRQAQSAVISKVLAMDINNLYVKDYTSVDEDI